MFTNQKVQLYANRGSIVKQNKNIMEINTPKGGHIQQLAPRRTETNQRNMELKNIVLHHIKREENQVPTLNLSDNLLDKNDATVNEFVEKLL